MPSLPASARAPWLYRHGVDLPRAALPPSGLLLAGLAFFVLAQAYTIPLVPLGRVWALWPSLPDLAFAVLAAIALLRLAFRGQPLLPGAPARGLAIGFGLLIVGAFASFLLLTLPADSEAGRSVGLQNGSYQLLRLGQAWLVFCVAAAVELPPRWRALLATASAVVLLVACCAVMLTAAKVVSTADFAAQLPREIEISGPWYYYAHGIAGAVGTLGYNHAYVAAHLMVLLVLRLVLREGRHAPLDTACFIAAFIAVAVCGSRAGFAAMVLFLLGYLTQRPTFAAAVGVVVFFLVVGAELSQRQQNWTELFDPAIERQSTLTRPVESGNLSGRDQIWTNRLEFLNEDPVRWVLGTGFGSSRQSGENAHLLYLHVVVETGLVGLLFFLLLVAALLRALYRAGGARSPVLWGTVALLFSGLTQETLYPVPAFLNFLAFFGFVLGLALRNAGDPRRWG